MSSLVDFTIYCRWGTLGYFTDIVKFIALIYKLGQRVIFSGWSGERTECRRLSHRVYIDTIKWPDTIWYGYKLLICAMQAIGVLWSAYGMIVQHWQCICTYNNCIHHRNSTYTLTVKTKKTWKIQGRL